MLFLSIETYLLVTLVVIVAVQYAFALLCLVKLAYLDVSKREYVLWNLFILLVFFIGGIVFLVYYYKKGKDRRIKPYEASEQQTPDDAQTTAENNAVDSNVDIAEHDTAEQADSQNSGESVSDEKPVEQPEPDSAVEQPDSAEQPEPDSVEKTDSANKPEPDSAVEQPDSAEKTEPVIAVKKATPKKPRAAKKTEVKDEKNNS